MHARTRMQASPAIQRALRGGHATVQNASCKALMRLARQQVNGLARRRQPASSRRRRHAVRDCQLTSALFAILTAHSDAEQRAIGLTALLSSSLAPSAFPQLQRCVAVRQHYDHARLTTQKLDTPLDVAGAAAVAIPAMPTAACDVFGGLQVRGAVLEAPGIAASAMHAPV